MKDADRLSQPHGKNDVGAALQLTQSNPNPTLPSASADNEQTPSNQQVGKQEVK